MFEFFQEQNTININEPFDTPNLQVICTPSGSITVRYSLSTPLLIDSTTVLNLKHFVLESTANAEILIKCSINITESVRLTADKIKCLSASSITASGQIEIDVKRLEVEGGSKFSLNGTHQDSHLNINHLHNNGTILINGQFHANISRQDGAGVFNITLDGGVMSFDYCEF